MKYIAFEGINGSGKSTQARLLAERLGKTVTVGITSEPHDRELLKDFSEDIASPAAVMAYLWDRVAWWDHFKEHFTGDLDYLISDRSYFSSAVYQTSEVFEPGQIVNINEALVPKPDLVIFLSVHPEVALKRLDERGAHDLDRDLEALRDVQHGYRDALMLSTSRIVFIADDGYKSAQEIHQQIVSILEAM